MSAINPIQASRPPIIPARGAGAGSQDPSASKADFGQTLRDYVNQVDESQQASTSTISDLLAGKNQDILPVVAAVAKADMSFKLLIGVRNKVIEAYKQTMNMQI